MGTDSFDLDAGVMKEYRQHKEFFFDKNIMLITLGTGVLWFLFRSNILDSLYDGFFYSSSSIALTLTLAIFIAQLPLQIFQDSNVAYCRYLRSTFSVAWIRFFCHDCLAIFGTLGVCFNFYGRALSPQCPHGVSLWRSQRCNHVAKVSSIPTDSVVFLLLLPLYLQMLFSCLSFKASFACFCLTTAFIGLAITQVGGHLEVWIFLTSFVVLLLMYNYERLSRITFLRYCHVNRVEFEKRGLIGLQLQAVDDLNFEKMSHMTEIFKMRSQEEYRLIESEKRYTVALLGNVAHDLKTPLQSFLMDLEALKGAIVQLQHVDRVPGELDSVSTIVTSLESTCIFMSMAINRSTDYLKINHEFALVPRMELFNISDELSGALNIIRLLKPQLTLIVNPLPASMSMDVISDKQWFYENLLCLLSNAAKYCDGGTVTVTVEHSPLMLPESEPAECDDVTPVDMASTLTSTSSSPSSSPSPIAATPSIIISVEDTGLGISEMHRKDFFKPFKQTDRQSGGTGLGLYCLSKRVSALNGTRGVASRKNGMQGSLFWFAIPYHPPQHFLTTHSADGPGNPPCPSENRSPHENASYTPKNSTNLFVPIPIHIPIPLPVPLPVSIPQTTSNQGGGGGNLRILVVDDSPSILKVLNRVLTNHNYAVDTAENGKVALLKMKDAQESQSLDIVLMDLQMPVMDGIEAVTLYRKYEDSRLTQSLSPSPTNCYSSSSSSSSSSSCSSSSCSSTAATDSSSLSSTALTPAPAPASAPTPAPTPAPTHASLKENNPSSEGLSSSYPSMGELQLNKVNALFIIGMSASSDEKYKRAALNAGMNFFLAKPFTMNELQPLIERFKTIHKI